MELYENHRNSFIDSKWFYNNVFYFQETFFEIVKEKFQYYDIIRTYLYIEIFI